MRCARDGCGRWRPDVFVRYAGSGLHLDGAWYCSSSCVEHAARERLRNTVRLSKGARPSVPPLKVGVLLVHQGVVTPAMVARALDEQQRTGLRLGAQLQRMGLAASSDVLRALAAQSGVSYLASIDRASVRPAPLGLSAGTIGALGLVPFEVDRDRRAVKVACTAPIPRVAVGAMAQLTGLSVEVFLVADDEWPGLVAAYGLAQPETAVPPAAACDLQEVAARVAHAAEQSRDLRLHHVRWDPYMWVRLERDDRTEDLMVPVGEPS